MKFSVKRMVGTSLATSAALAAFATTNVSADEVYTIESGDTLSAISRKFDLSIADLIEVNTIDNQDLIIAGHSLNIPTVDAPVVASTKRVADASNVYTVVAGDTLNKIAADFDTTAQNLRDLNGISGDLILVGQQLKVKGEVAQETTVEQIAPVAEETVETEVEATPVVEETVNNYVADVNGNYTVVAGDSINKIAGQFGVSASELRVQNNLSSDLILVGQSLAIPGLAAAPAVEEAPVVEETEMVVEVASVESTVATEEAEFAPVANSVEETETADAEIEAQVAAEEALAAEEEAQAAAEAQEAAELEAQEQAGAEAAAQAEAEAQAAADAQAAAEAEAAAQARAAAEAAAQAEAEAQAAAAEEEAQAAAEAEAAAQAQTGNVTALLNNAYAQVGVPYLWGGKTPSGFDCSGFVNYVYKQTYGVNVGSYTGEQQYAGSKISVSSAQPGDLIFWGSYGSPYHVAISLGNGQYIHSQRPGETVHSESINPYWAPSFAVSMAAYN
ncbi:LysM peptidoglycan-binding domain-containing protein [Aerococcus viridans]|uniref:LysM peptidoglycan-binding domain-containing protein n=1 Tax=Aerococcus viridans TaxID=1377 RepID=UPI002DBD753A|nr:LysM peptidoglycan-binding domain-containing protein [Aerococcus viridans]MEB7388822.1 LysM peptidoglycan-binding domain-containing protein [Aerococcus viridans]